MTSKTHAALGLLAGLATLHFVPSADVYTTISGACIGSLMPDLDTKKSDPSQIFPPIAFVVDKLTKHRGFTHTMFPLILLIIYFSQHYYPALVLGIGGISHLVIDVVTEKVGIRCQSRGEQVIFIVVWVVNLAVVGYFCYSK